jgi:hypothetical protein
MNPVRDDTATIACEICGVRFIPQGRQRYCDTPCRQTAWRRRKAAPRHPVVAKASIVYECGSCGTRLIGIQRCEDCNTWARRVGPGGCCPHCDEPVAVSDLIEADQFADQGGKLTKVPTT